jgi:ABC-type multidrug transport system permease subunit
MFLNLFFLFGGLVVPYPGLAEGWRWAFYLDPFSYVLEAIVTPQVHCGGADASRGCASIQYFCGNSCPAGAVGGVVVAPVEQIVQSFYGECTESPSVRQLYVWRRGGAR